jgi:mannitol/fructose-specific phosphotransferase system IIA component (Ntr-type)
LEHILHPRSVAVDLQATAMDEVIERMVALLVEGRSDLAPYRRQLLETARAREDEISTCLGHGIAVPHGTLPEGTPLAIAVGLSRTGMEIRTPDGAPLQAVFLLATADDQRDIHLRILAWIARTFGGDPDAFDQLVQAPTAEAAYAQLEMRMSQLQC